jgi:hypothetical protein
MEDLEILLQDYVATANNPEYNKDYSIINSKFAKEIEEYDWNTDVLEAYVDTANNPEYEGDWGIINSKFQDDLFKTTDPVTLYSADEIEEVKVTPTPDEYFTLSPEFFTIETEKGVQKQKKEDDAANELNAQLNGLGIKVDTSGFLKQEITITTEQFDKETKKMVTIDEQVISLRDDAITNKERADQLNSIINNRIEQLQDPNSDYYVKDFDVDLYKNNYQIANARTYIEKITVESTNKKGKTKTRTIDVDKANFEELLNHRNKIHLELSTEFYKTERGQDAINSINNEINQQTSQILNDLLSREDYDIEMAIYEFDQKYKDIIKNAWSNNEDIKKMMANNNLVVGGMFDKKLLDLHKKENVKEEFGSIVANYGFLTGLARTSFVQIPMAIQQYSAINRSERIETASKALKEMSTMSDDDMYNYGYTEVMDSRLSIPLKNYKVGDLRKMLSAQIDEHNIKLMTHLMKADEYQQILQKMPSPELFKDGKLNLTMDNYAEALGDQTAQMIFSIFSVGMSTMVQEAGGAYHDIVRRKAEKLNPNWKNFTSEQKIKAMIEVVDSGNADLKTAKTIGSINMALDNLSNVFFIGKVAKPVTNNLNSFFELMIKGRYKKALKNLKPTKEGVLDVGAVSIVEAFTEAGQEEVMQYGVGTSVGDYKHNWDQTFNAGITALLTTPIIGMGAKSVKVITTELSARIEMINNPEGVIALSRKQEAEYVRLLELYRTTNGQKGISEQKYDELMENVIAIQNQFDPTNVRVRDGEAAIDIFNNELEIVKKEKQLEKLNTEKEKLTKKNKDKKTETQAQKDNNAKILNIEESIEQNRLNQTKARKADFYKTEGYRLANEMNNDENISKNWEVNIYENTNDGIAYIQQELGVNINKAMFKRFKNGTANAFVLSKEDILKIKPNYEGKGVVIVSNENIVNNINKGLRYAENAIHHELEHILMDEKFKGVEGTNKLIAFQNTLATIIDQSTDPQMAIISSYLKRRIKQYQKIGIDIRSKDPRKRRAAVEEFFAGISDVTRGLSLETLSAESQAAFTKIGEIFKEFLHTDLETDVWNAENTIDFINYFESDNADITYNTVIDENDNEVIVPSDELVIKESISESDLKLIDDTNPYSEGRSNEDISLENERLTELIQKQKEYTNPDNLDLQKRVRDGVSQYEQKLIYNNFGAFKKLIFENYDKRNPLHKIPGNYEYFIAESLLQFTKGVKSYINSVGKPGMAPFGAYYFGKQAPSKSNPYGKSIATLRLAAIFEGLKKEFDPVFPVDPVDPITPIDPVTIYIDNNEKSKIRKGLPGMEENTENYTNFVDGVETTMSEENFDWVAFMTDPDALSKLDKKGKQFYKQLKNSFSEKTYKNYNHTQFYIDYITENAKNIYMQLDQKTMNTAFTEFTEVDPTAEVSEKTGRLTVIGSLKEKIGIVKSKTAGNIPRRKLKWNDEIEAQFIERLLKTDQIERLRAEGKTTAEIHKLVRVDMLQKSTFEHLSKILFKDAMMQTITSDEFKATNGIDKAEIARMALLIDKGIDTKFSLAGEEMTIKNTGSQNFLQQVSRLKTVADEYWDEDADWEVIAGVLRQDKTLKDIPQDVKDFVSSLYEQDFVERAESKQFTSDMKKNELISPEVRDEAKQNIRNSPETRKKMMDNAEIIVKSLPKELLNNTTLEFLGFHYRGLDVAGSKKDKDGNIIPGKTGEFYERYQKLLNTVDGLKEGDLDFEGSDIRIYNKDVPLKQNGVFAKLINILEKDISKEAKIKEIEESGLKEEIQKANVANIKAFKTITKTIAGLVKDGKLDEAALIQMYKAQSFLTFGNRGMSRLDGYLVLNGSQKGTNWKGEHAASISKVDAEILDLIYRYKNDPTIDLDAEMDVILAGYGQILGEKADFDILDEYGRTNITDTYKFNMWDRNTANKYVGLDDESLKDMQMRILSEKETKVNVIKTKKKADAIEKINNKKTKTGTIQGATVMDFDETVGISDNYVIARKDGKTKRIPSDQWPVVGEQMVNEGWQMDFTDFNRVTDGKPGPLFDKLKNQIEKYGVDNVYILTARAAESAPAIQAWLASEGINLPLENITGLGNSTGQAKADWIENNLILNGFNDIYFVDDAHQNVDAVQNMFNQYPEGLLVEGGKSIIVNPLIKYSISGEEDLSKSFNDIIESSTGVESYKTYSEAQGKIRGDDQRSIIDVIYPPSAYDLEMFTYRYITKGELGENQQAFFQEKLFKPFETAINKINQNQQRVKKEYRDLIKQLPTVRKNLGNTVEGTNYTYDQAVRVYLWTKNNMEVPGLSKTDQKALVKAVSSDPELIQFADRLSIISQRKKGYIEPTEYWTIENIAYDLNTMTGKVSRAEYLAEWKENVNQLFSQENKNKLRALYGNDHVEALEDMLYRMEFGRNKTKPGRIEQQWNNWVNNSVGAIMFFNMRSAALQTISAVNYVDWSDNNPARAAAAFANQPQFWKDFAYIFNSDYLKERRAGSKRTINEAELTAHLKGSTNKAKAAIAWLLNKGFLPTQIADSFAIASGGASYYRNKIKAYEKQGMSTKEAEAQAWLDFQQKTEYGQQSSRPDLISQQQSGGLGRLILAFKNTPMQYNRLMIKAILDLKNNRGSTRENMSKIAYYGVAQNIIFTSLQTALWTALGSEDEWDNKKERVANGMIDSILNGMGLTGAVAVTIKNGYLQYVKQRKRGFKGDHTYTIIQFANLSPTIGSKLRKLYGSITTEQYNRDAIKEMGFNLENPAFNSLANLISATTNVPLDRAVQKAQNIILASKSETEAMDSFALLMGYNPWDLGIETEAKKVKKEIKERKKIEKKEQDKIKKENIKIQKEKELETEIEKEKEQEKEGTKTEFRCSGIKSNGERCNIIVSKAGDKCTVHEKVKQRDDGKKVQCKKIKTNGKRCKVKTNSASGLCYYHD